LVHLCGQPTQNWFRDGFLKNVEHTVMNSDATFQVRITSNLDQAPDDESWGLYRARVWVAP
jgi:hypothetical protein